MGVAVCLCVSAVKACAKCEAPFVIVPSASATKACAKCEEPLWRSADGVCVLVLRPFLSTLRLPFLDEQTLQKVIVLQTCVRRAKQRKRSARTVEFATWCVSFSRCELVRDAKCGGREGGCWLE
jgi:hypothetical protein